MENTFFFRYQNACLFFQIDLTFEFHQDGACGVKYLYNTRNNFIILLLLLFFKTCFQTPCQVYYTCILIFIQDIL